MLWKYFQRRFKHSRNEVHYALTGRAVGQLRCVSVAVGPQIDGAVVDSEYKGVWRELGRQVAQHLS